MPSSVLNLRLSDATLTMLDRLCELRKGPHGEDLSPEEFVFGVLQQVGAAWSARWNLIHAHGSCAVDPQGQVVITLAELPEDLPVGTGSPNANLHVEMPDLTLDRIDHAYAMNVAFSVHQGKGNPWPTLTAWTESFLTDAIAIATAQIEDEREAKAVEAMKRKQLLELERRRRRAQLEGGESPESPAPVPSPTASASTGGGGARVAVLSDSSGASEGGTDAGGDSPAGGS